MTKSFSKWFLLTAAVALAPLAFSTSAQAEGYAKKAGDILLRGRVLAVVPSENADLTGAITGDDLLKIDNSVVPELDLTYFLTDNLAVEVIAGVTPHDVDGKDALAGVDFGKVWLLPPTVTLQYHFGNLGPVSPYVGAGLNYTTFFGADDWDDAVVADVNYGNSWGGALQAGVDVPLGTNWALNFDVKKVWINSDVNVTLAGSNARVDADVDINPWIVGLGVGYKF